ncbi:MAG: TVP38/TMEM64 family protein [Arachnia sp.]
MGTWVRLGLFVGLLAVGVAVLLLVPLPSAAAIHEWAMSGGAWVPLTFVGIYAVSTLLPIPKNVLSAAAGLAFGLGLGTGLVWLGAMLGSAASFALGRVLGRDGVRRLAGVRFEKLDALVLRHGLIAVLIARLIPVVPFTAVNYGSGLTAIPFPAYLLATGVGILPGTIAYVAVGAYGADPGSWPFLVAVGALLLLSVGGALLARRRGTSGDPTTSGDAPGVSDA